MLKQQRRATGGVAPYGSSSFDGRRAWHQGEQETLAAIIEHRTAGLSWAKVADKLNATGHRTRTGGQWTRQGAHQVHQARDPGARRRSVKRRQARRCTVQGYQGTTAIGRGCLHQPRQGAAVVGRENVLDQGQCASNSSHRDHHHCTFLTDREVEIYDGVDYEGFSYY